MHQVEGRYRFSQRFYAIVRGGVCAFFAYPAVICFPTLTLNTYGKLTEDLVILDMCNTFHGTQKFICRKSHLHPTDTR